MGRSYSINDMVRKKIREIRLSKRLGVSELAAKAGLPLSSYASMENGDYKINLDNLFRILGVLEADITDVWPAEAVGVRAIGEQVYLMRLQEFRLNELISLAGAEGGALFCLEDGRCSVLLHQHLSEFLLDRLILYLEEGRSFEEGLWWKETVRGTHFAVFLKAASCPGFLHPLVKHYLTTWCALFSESSFRETAKKR